MNGTRDEALQEFVDALRSAFVVALGSTPAMRVFQSSLFQALAKSESAGIQRAANLPVCAHLPSTIQSAMMSAPEVGRLATAFEKIAPKLTWKVRSSSGPHASESWLAGHANVVIIGPGGIEERSDISIGASLLAPHVRYPDHSHPPEELYLVLTSGRFQHASDDWFEPGPGGLFHNTPGIKHAMASDDQPLLAFWCLKTPTGGAEAGPLDHIDTPMKTTS